MTYKTKIKLSDATDGMRVQFVNHYHQIIDKEIDCTHMIGTVTKHDHGMIEGGSYDGQSHFEIQVKLEDCRIYSKGELDDWDQTLIFHYPHDEDYKNVMVYVLEKPILDVMREYFASCIEDVDIPKEFESLSYLNDVFPSVGYKGFQIWIGHKDPKKNEKGFQDYSEMKRFSVYKNIDGELYKGKSFDTWEEVLKHVGYEKSSELLNLMSATFNYKLDFESWSHKKFVKFTRDFIDGKTEYLMDDMFITNDLQRVKQLLEEVTNE